MDFSLFLEHKGRITAEDVIKFRREIFQDMVVSRSEGEGVFALNNAIEDTCREWNDFFVEAMVDYCVNQAEPRGYMSDSNADWLMSQIVKDGRLDTNSELELVVKIIERAHEVPTQFAAFALEQVADAVIEGNGKLLNTDEIKPGVIGAAEANLVRRVLYGVGADGSIKISKEEVEVLFKLNDMTIEAENHPEWTDVFVKAVACHLMAAGGYQMISRKEAMRREAWLDDTTSDVSGMLAMTLSSVGRFMSGGGFSAGLGEMSASEQLESAWAQRNMETAALEQQASVVDADESHWLVERIGRDGVLHDNEKALLEYLKQESPELHPSLKPLLEKVA